MSKLFKVSQTSFLFLVESSVLQFLVYMQISYLLGT